ncbi:MAG TPA: hypothetical protein PLJ60_00950 [Chryseolinea sp.]|nr:hypothetical protein [Chryseolinea sp.]HPH46245.1 hypothetical protein [Chryseolinea sp.]HPM28876.1 hypothetical protein [Chryseolinea sp.]
MKKIFGLIFLGLLFGCEQEDLTPSLKFNGQIINGDLDSSTPLKDIKVKISYYGNGFHLLKIDSALTDDSGNYFFQILDEEAIQQYSIQIRDDYYFQCNSLFPIVNNFIIPKDINKAESNSDTLKVCLTGKIELFVTKLDVAAKDTLTVSSKLIRGSLTFISSPTTILNSKQWSEYYFTKFFNVVEYNFKLKKENGEITNWSIEKEPQSQVTKELIITF